MIVTMSLFGQKRDGYNASKQVLKKKTALFRVVILKKNIFSAVTLKQERRSLLTGIHLELFIFIP